MLQTQKGERAVATQGAALKLQCAVMSHTKKDLDRAAQEAESKAVVAIEESQKLSRHAEQIQVPVPYIVVLSIAPRVLVPLFLLSV